MLRKLADRIGCGNLNHAPVLSPFRPSHDYGLATGPGLCVALNVT
jgi:hypothetical protein